MSDLTNALNRIDKILTSILKWLTIGFTAAITLIISADIFLRYVPLTTLTWKEEIIELCFAGLVFFGAAAVWMAKGHFTVGDFLVKKIKGERAKAAYQLGLEIFTLAFAAVLFWYSLQLSLRAYEATSVFNIPKKYIYLCMPASAAIMIAYSLGYVARNIITLKKPKAIEKK